jgi:Flp pilus assembly protein TadG
MRWILQNLKKLWHEERGSIAVDWAMVTTVLILGAITGVILTQTLEAVDNSRPGVFTRP